MTTSIIPEFCPQSRFLFIEAPLQQLPHNCASCRRYDRPEPDREGHLTFIDFNVDIEFFGKIFICEDCLREMVNQFGWADENQVKRYNNAKAGLLEQIKLLSEENENLRNAVGNLSSLATATVSLGSSYVVPVEGSEETPDGSVGDTALVSDGEFEEPRESVIGSDNAAGTNEELARPDDVEGPTDVRGDDDLEQLLNDL